MKRVMDFIIAAFGLFILLPFIIILMIGIYFDSGAPALFKQRRLGKDKREFTCLKLRSMPQSTKSLPSHEVVDVKISRYSRLLRRFKLDELPQLFNVLSGEMSLVGPRPCLPQQSELILLRSQKNIFSLRPGITGYAQIHDVDMSDPARLVSFESNYLSKAGVLLDLKILLATVMGKGLHIDAAEKRL
jgi:O-antigen biosynthesis protein WbqP